MSTSCAEPVAKSENVGGPPGFSRTIAPQLKSAARYLPSYATGQAPVGTHAPPVIEPQPVAVVPGIVPCGYSAYGSMRFGGVGLHLPDVRLVCAPSRQGQP